MMEATFEVGSLLTTSEYFNITWFYGGATAMMMNFLPWEDVDMQNATQIRIAKSPSPNFVLVEIQPVERRLHACGCKLLHIESRLPVLVYESWMLKNMDKVVV